jgi:hypothetical protein
MRSLAFLAFVFSLMLAACGESAAPEQAAEKSTKAAAQPLFELLDPTATGIQFQNNLVENDSINVIRYDYLYNGGGVAVGDFNNDGLQDLYFTGNQVNDKLYLNTGDLTFEDASVAWGIDQYPGWSSGASVVDINGDGWLDVYVCRTGPHIDATQRTNRLFINQEGKGFIEDAKRYGLDYTGHSTQAAFFDADRDGDLDCYLVTHPDKFRNRLDMQELTQMLRDGLLESDRYFRNEFGRFVDATEALGILDFAFGLGVAIDDVNLDGWPDIYVSNDFDEGDHLWVNHGDGTFKNEVTVRMKHTSNYGMGCDFADFNNDRWPDLLQLDMAFETHERAKRNMASMDLERFQARVQLGWHYQYMVNTLQLNNGDNTFSDIAQVSGVHQTDWSWAGLFADFDLDGLQDIYITNGYKRDTKDNDLRKNVAELQQQQEELALGDILDLIPSTKLRNYAFQNVNGLEFERSNEQWGLQQKINSNGAAYADLDNDGDLELIVNNIDEVASVYKNTAAEQAQHNWIAFKLPQRHRIGARVMVTADGNDQVRYAQPVRGYLGSVDDRLYFGLGTSSGIDSVTVWWSDGTADVYKDLSVNAMHDLVKQGARSHPAFSRGKNKRFETVADNLGIDFVHRENKFNDFKEEVLLPHRMSQHGPALAVADFTGDGREDVFIGGTAGQAAAMYAQTADGRFERTNQPDLQRHLGTEDVSAEALDADRDGDMDLYVSSGDAGQGSGSPFLQDRLYVNENGVLRDATGLLPKMLMASGAAKAADADKDGDPDIFVAGRHIPGRYPYAPGSKLLRNTGRGYEDATQELFPAAANLGMVTDATWVDLDGDGWLDLVVVGEWMSPQYFLGGPDGLSDAQSFGEQLNGWWFSVEAADIDGDGDQDLICGNLGENNKFHPKPEKPLLCYVNDFDDSGTLDIVLAKYGDETLLPVRGRECSSEQMPFIAQKFDDYESFATSDLESIYTSQKLEAADQLVVHTFSSVILINEGDHWSVEELPVAAQLAPVRSIITKDLDGDQRLDLILSGNFFGAEVETVRYDAGNGVVLYNTSNGWRVELTPESGLSLPFDMRYVQEIEINGQSHLIGVANQSRVRVVRIKN